VNIRSFLCIILMLCGFLEGAHADPAPTGFFKLPYNEGQQWSLCGSIGWLPMTQFHMRFDNEEPNPTYKYHMGEDWNGKCGGDSDEGAPLFALADGEISFLDNGIFGGQGKRLYIRYAIPYSYAPNGVMLMDSGYLHLKDIASGLAFQSQVVRGQTVGTLGKTATTSISAHLHWHMYWNASLDSSANPYKPVLSKADALKYRAPSLIVDDRRDEIVHPISTGGYYTIFTMYGIAPSSTAYIEYGGERKSLKKAIEAGWLTSNMLAHESGGSWYYWPDVDMNFFDMGRTYAVSSYVANATLHIPFPRNNFQDDRARLDMLHEVEDDSRVASLIVEWYGNNTGLYSDWNLHWMWVKLTDEREMYVTQITSKTNPFIRYTDYFDMDTNQWRGWQAVDRNKLY